VPYLPDIHNLQPAGHVYPTYTFHVVPANQPAIMANVFFQ